MILPRCPIRAVAAIQLASALYWSPGESGTSWDGSVLAMGSLMNNGEDHDFLLPVHFAGVVSSLKIAIGAYHPHHWKLAAHGKLCRLQYGTRLRTVGQHLQ